MLLTKEVKMLSENEKKELIEQIRILEEDEN